MPIFVIHKHKARNLHYDFRLEKDNVLKSWAVPKEPPRSTNVKRLAVMVDDHALEYANFSGIIPKGNYWAGKVEIWDKGTYEEIEWGSKKIIVDLKGKKLNGIYCLIHFKPKEKNWLFLRRNNYLICFKNCFRGNVFTTSFSSAHPRRACAIPSSKNGKFVLL